MTNIDKIVKIAQTISSCKTKDHIITCHKWVTDLCNKEIITQHDYMFLFSAYHLKWIEITNE